MFKMLNRISLSQKMILIFVGCVIIPFALQNYFFYVHTEKNIQEVMLLRLNTALNEKADKIKGNISGIVTLTNSFHNNEQMYWFLDKEYTNDINYLTTYQDELKKVITSDITYHLQVKKITLYTDNPTLFSGAYVKKMVPLENIEFGEKLLDYNEVIIGEPGHNVRFRIALEPIKLKTTEDRSVSIVRELDYYPQYSEYKKIIRIDLNIVYLSSILSDNNLFDNMILVDSDNRIIMSTSTYSNEGAYEIFNPNKMKDGIVLLEKKIEGFPLTLYGLYDSKIISSQFTKERLKTLAITFGGLCFASICILIIAGNITKRTRRVVNQSKEIAQGNFIQIANPVMGDDEICILEKSMNQMSEQLRELIEKEYSSKLIQARLERETAQAKLLALQSQVNPHFMFNALESIRLKALTKGEHETATMIKYMSRMFRHLINWEEDIICLKDDIKFLDEFLCIQKYRFEDEFSYYVSVEEAAKTCLLPKLIIQPLVENACVHGVEAISNNREVSVSAKVEEQWLILIVKDNGGGMSKERLKALQGMLQNKEILCNSVGIYNVYQRLLLYYGDQFRFDVESVQGEGTTCTIKIPVEYER